MKKTAILLTAALVAGLAACGSDDTADPPAETAAPAADTEVPETSDPDASETSQAEVATTEAEVATTEAEQADELIPVSLIAPSPSFNSGPLLAMMVNEYGRANGLDIDYRGAGASSTNIVAAVLSGEFDFGAPSTTTTLDAINQGADLVIVGAAVKTASTLVAGTHVFEEAGITPDSPLEDRVEAIRGRTIVTSPVGSGSAVALRSILQSHGLDPDGDVDIVHVNEATAMVAGVRQGRFDAGFYGSGVLEVLAVDQVGDVLVRAAEVPVLADQLRLSVMTTQEYADANPDVVEKMYRSIADALEAIHADPHQFYEPLQEAYFADLDPRVFNVAWDNAAPDYPLTPTYTRAALESGLEQQTEATGNDYSGLVYEEVVHPVAQQ